MTTVQAVIDRVLRDLGSGDRDERNRLAANVTADATTWTFTYDLNGIQSGSVVCCGTETVFVWDTSSQAATVTRGDDGSTAAAHDAGDPVTVNPRFTPAAVFDAINDEILAVSSEGLFQMKAVDLTTTATARTYDLTAVTTMLGDPWEIRYDASGAENTWPLVRNWTVSRSMPTADFPSGLMLRVDEYLPAGRTMRVRYRAPFTAATDPADTIEGTVGMPATAIDVVLLGVQARLMSAKETKRTQIESSSDSRRGSDVPVMSAVKTASYLWQLRNSRLVREVARLEQEWGPRARR